MNIAFVCCVSVRLAVPGRRADAAGQGGAGVRRTSQSRGRLQNRHSRGTWEPLLNSTSRCSSSCGSSRMMVLVMMVVVVVVVVVVG